MESTKLGKLIPPVSADQVKLYYPNNMFFPHQGSWNVPWKPISDGKQTFTGNFAPNDFILVISDMHREVSIE
ncbi:hypothetical protein B9D94_22445 [Paenibacillus sp. Cedars]|nr:hypothetical protein B9D94_22445 [Paenibacillus sp. Cedars]